MEILFSEEGLIFWAYSAAITGGIITNAILGIMLWPYSLNKWIKFVGGIKIVGWKIGLILSFVPFFGQITVPVALCTFCFMLIFARK
jgi:hypothetical protein